MGTDDTGATADDPTGGGAEGNNMVLVTQYEYDSGNDGGDGNLTQQTQHVDGSTTRVTSFSYEHCVVALEAGRDLPRQRRHGQSAGKRCRRHL